MKLNYGCGEDYKEGWVNLDINPSFRTDVLIKPNTPLPFPDNSFDYILMDNVLEHIKIEDVRPLFKEFQRILKSKGILEIYVPHFTGILTKYLSHYKGYGVNSFCDERDMFKVLKEELFLINRNRMAGYKSFRFLNSFNFLFNFNFTWQQICEKFWLFGFEEIRFVMEVRK